MAHEINFSNTSRTELLVPDQKKEPFDLEKLPNDLMLKILSYLGNEISNIPSLNKRLHQLLTDEKNYLPFVRIYFAHLLPQNAMQPETRNVWKHIMASKLIYENIRQGRFVSAGSKKLKWLDPVEQGQGPIIGERRFAKNKDVIVEAPRFLSSNIGSLIFKNLSNDKEVIYRNPHESQGPTWESYIGEMEMRGTLLVTIAAGSNVTSKIKIWDMNTCTCSKSFADQIPAGLTGLHLGDDCIYVGNNRGDILRWKLTDPDQAKPTILLKSEDLKEDSKLIRSIVQLDHFLIASTADFIHVLDLQTKNYNYHSEKIRFASNKKPITCMTICPVTRVLFIGEHYAVSAWKVQENGELILLNRFESSRTPRYMKMDGRKLIVAFYLKEEEKQEREFVFDFCSSINTSKFESPIKC